MLNLRPRLSRDGKLVETDRGWLLSIPAGPRNQYRLSQLDDHLGIARRKYPWRPPLKLHLEARVSAVGLPGTWGFGLWNDPYGFSFGPGNGFLRLPALPDTAWFFYSSQNSHLSFRNDMPANGLLAQAFASPGFSPRLLLAGAAFPFSRPATRRILSRIIRELSARITLDGATPAGTPAAQAATQWRAYDLEWLTERTRFLVDGQCVLDAPFSPGGPLGLVIWIDNQYAGFYPDGRIRWGLEGNPEPAWVEIRDLELHTENH